MQTPAHLLSLWRPLEYTGRNFRIVEEVAGSENTFLVEKISTGKVYELFQHEITMEEIEFQELAASVADGIVAEVRELAAQEGDTSISMLDDSDIDVPEAAVRGRIASGLIDATVPHHAIVARLEQYFAEMHLQQQQQSTQNNNNTIVAADFHTATTTTTTTTTTAIGGPSTSFRNRPKPPAGPLTMDALLAGESSSIRPRQSQATAEDSTDTAPAHVSPKSPSPTSLPSKFYCPVQRIIDTWVCEVDTAASSSSNARPGSPSGPRMVSLCVNVVQEHVPYTLHTLASVRHVLAPDASSHSADWTALETKTITQSILFVNAALDDLCAEGFVAERYGPSAVSVASLDTTTVGCRTTGDLLIETCKVRIGAFASIPACSVPPCVLDWEVRYPRSVWESAHRDVVAVLYGLGHAPRGGGGGVTISSPRSTPSTATSPMLSPKGSTSNLLRHRSNIITPQVSYHLVSRLNKFTIAMFLLDMLRQVPEEDVDQGAHHEDHNHLGGGGGGDLRTYPSLGVTTSTGRYHLPPPALPTSMTSIFISRFMRVSELSPSPSSSSTNIEDEGGSLSTLPPSGGAVESTTQDHVLLLLVRSMIVALLGGGGGYVPDGCGGDSSSKPPFDSLPLDALAKMCSLYPTPPPPSTTTTTTDSSGKRRRQKSRSSAGSIPAEVEIQYRQYAMTIWRMCTNSSSGGGGSIMVGSHNSILNEMSLGRPNTAASSSWGSMQRSSRPATTPAKPPALRLRSGDTVSLPTGLLQRPTSTILGYNLDGTINTTTSHNNTYSTSSEKIVASVGIEEVRHVYYCSSFDYEAHYNGDGGRRRRQFYEGYHKQRYPHGTVPRAPPAVFSVKPPTHSIPCHSWSHEEAIANLHRKQSASQGGGGGALKPGSNSPRAITASSSSTPHHNNIPSRPTTSGTNSHMLATYSSRPGTTAGSRPIWANQDYDEQYASAKKEKKESTIDYSKRLRTGARELRTTSALVQSLERAQVSEMGNGVVMPTESPRRSSARHHHARSSSSAAATTATPSAAPALPFISPPPASAGGGGGVVPVKIKGSHNRYYPAHVAAKLPSSPSSPRRPTH